MFSKRSVCRAFSAAAFVSSLIVSNAAEACSICGCGDPLVIAGDARPVAGNLRLALDAEYLTASARSDDQPTATEGITQYILRPILVWSPIESLSLVLQLPFTHKDWELTGGDGTPPAHNSGLGDIDVGARWFVWQQTDLRRLRRQNLALTAGASLPTGVNNLQDANGNRLDDHAQLGTGSYGPYVGGLYAFHQDPWNLSVNVSARAHTTNSFGYHYGAAALWSVRGTYRLIDRLAFVLGVDGRYASQDSATDPNTAVSVTQANTGGLVLEAVPGLAFNAVDNFWIHVRAQVPFFTRFFGQQTLGPVITLSLQYSFAG